MNIICHILRLDSNIVGMEHHPQGILKIPWIPFWNSVLKVKISLLIARLVVIQNSLIFLPHFTAKLLVSTTRMIIISKIYFSISFYGLLL